MANYTVSLSKQLSALTGKEILLIMIETKKYQNTYPLIIKKVTQRKSDRGIYVSFNKSHSEIKLVLKKAKTGPERFYIIDTIGKSNKNDKEGCCLAGPESLTQLSIILTQLMKTRKYTCLFFDNLSSFLIYHDLETTERFIHYLVGKLQFYGMRGIFLSLNDKKSKDLVEVISPFFDRRIDLTK